MPTSRAAIADAVDLAGRVGLRTSELVCERIAGADTETRTIDEIIAIREAVRRRGPHETP